MSSSAPCAPSNSSESPRRARVLQQRRDIADHRQQRRRESQRRVERLLEGNRVALEVLRQHEVVIIEQRLELRGEAIGIEQVLQAHRAPRDLVFVGRADAASGGADAAYRPSHASRAWSSATWYGSTSGHAGEIASRERTSTPAASSSPISCSSADGDSTTPLPM